MAADATPLSDVRFLTVAEVAAIMRVSKMTVYRLVHSGELEAIRVGRSFRVPEQAVTDTSGRHSWARADLPWRAPASRARRQLPAGARCRAMPGNVASRRYAVALACCPAARSGEHVHGHARQPGKQLRVVSWVQSSRSGASGWRRRSTASCCVRRGFSAGTRSSAAWRLAGSSQAGWRCGGQR